jgi:hypothetical protein
MFAILEPVVDRGKRSGAPQPRDECYPHDKLGGRREITKGYVAISAINVVKSGRGSVPKHVRKRKKKDNNSMSH